MLFNSLSFLVFFGLTVVIYFSIPHRFRWMLLLAGSCFFYMAFVPKYILILFAVILIDYLSGLAIERSRGRKRRYWLLASILSNVGILVAFKYFNFLMDNLQPLAGFLNLGYPLPHLSWILPIGLSFHTFQSLSYVIEVYRGKQTAERHLGIYALYVMFFPQLVAGPIERPQNLLHQFKEAHGFDAARTSSGLRRMLYGFVKKMVIADNAAIVSNQVFGNIADQTPVSLAVGAAMFAFQIYGDFSGYSDIAIGSARILGFRLMENFDSPYLARSIPEFWRRWHISLTSWFKDYVYIPLGGNRCGRWKQVRNVLAVFLLSGLWHGANWTFIIWGGLNGVAIVFSNLTSGWRAKAVSWFALDRAPRLHTALQIFLTFCFVCFGWIFFRAQNLGQGLDYVRRIFSWDGWVGVWRLAYWKDGVAGYAQLGMQRGSFAVLAFLAIGLLAWEGLPVMRRFARSYAVRPAYVRWVGYYAAILLIFSLAYFGHRPFIYFQF